MTSVIAPPDGAPLHVPALGRDLPVPMEVPDAGVLAVFSRYRSYRAAREGALPIIRVGQRIMRVPTASGALVAAATGQPLSAQLGPAGGLARPIRDRADLRVAINCAPTDPLTRPGLVDLAQALGRLHWIPDGWPAPVAALAPDAAEELVKLTHHGHSPEEERQSQRDGVHGKPERSTDPKTRHRYPVDPPAPVRQR
jgi:hypothetical protein